MQSLRDLLALRDQQIRLLEQEIGSLKMQYGHTELQTM